MPRTTKPVAAFVGILVALAAPDLLAQAPQFVKARIITLSWTENIKDLWYQTKDGPKVLEAYSRGLTTPVEYTGPATIHFHPAAETFTIPIEKRPAPLAIANLPSGGGDFLFIFTSKVPEAPGWNIRVIDNSLQNFPPGAYRFLNLTTHPLQIALDDTIGAVGASAAAVLRPTRGEPVRDLQVRLALGKEIVYDSIWGHEEKRRGTVFIVPDPYGRNGMNVRQFYQAVVPQKPES